MPGHSSLAVANNVRALGWFVRFLREKSDAHLFYRTTLQLPLIRGAQDLYQVFWGGEALIYELLMVKGRGPAPAQRADSAGCTPVFRAHELDALVGRLKAAGTTVVSFEEVWYGRQAMLLDPDGRLLGLREQDADSPLAEDNLARRRQRRGETFNPGCDLMPAQLQEMGWILRRVVDVARMTRFYVDTVGLTWVAEHAGHVYLSMGDNSLLELAPGGRTHAVPADRSGGEDTFLLRVSDADALRDRLRSSGLPFVNEKLEYYWTDICYCTDPEGQMFGFQQIRHPRSFAPKPAWPENLEAQRRWVESQYRLRCA